MRDLFPDITTAADQLAATLAAGADSLDRLVARHLPTESRRASTVARIFCPHCEQETDADHCADDITTGIPFKSYVCLRCDEFVATTEPCDRITAEAYIDLIAAHPQAATRWRIDVDPAGHVSYVPTVAEPKPPCTCGGRGVCTMCVLAAFEAEEETLLGCHRCGRFSVGIGTSFCPHCGSGDTGVTHPGHDSWPTRGELLAADRKQVA